MVGDEIELDLGLSIGGSFGKPEKLRPVKKVYAPTVDSESNGSEVDVPENRPALAGAGELADPQAKREMHELRRREAKRKREEKQETKRSTCRAKNGKYGSEWATEEEQGRKLERTDEQVQMQWRHSDGVNGAPFQAVAATVHYPYAPVQYVPFPNGGLGGFPCVMPCWVPRGGAFEESTWRGFRPYKTNQSTGLNLSNGYQKDGVNGETASYGSTMCGSSAGSEDPSSSHEGGGSVDSRSRSSYSLPSRSQLDGHKANDTKGHPENSASPDPVESDHGNNDSIDHTGKVVGEATSTAQPRPATPKEEEAVPPTDAEPSVKPVPNTNNSSPGPVKETRRDVGKPPKPQTQNQNTPLLPQMPYVSTTGNGPNGKTVTGFLYRYTKSEVSIVCVCHGSTFSPAEFVQHAGGTDVSHPLRHIRVIPSAFG